MRLAVAVSGLLGVLHASTLRAEEYAFSRVALLSTGCSAVGLGDADLRAAVASELAASSLELVPMTQPAAATDVTVAIRLPCSPGTKLALTATWHDRTLDRTLQLEDLSNASRARALALVVAELLAQLAEPRPPPTAADSPPPAAAVAPPTPERVELAETPETPTPAAPKPAKPRPRRAAPRSAPRIPRAASNHEPEAADSDADERASGKTAWFLAAGPEVRSFFDGPTLSGGNVRLDRGVLVVGLSVLDGSTTVTNGTLSALVIHGIGAVRALTFGSPERATVSFGPRVGLGYLSVSAEAASSSVDAGVDQEPYLDAAGFAAFAFHVASAVRIDAAAELGYARGVNVLSDSAAVADYGGPFVSALIDVALNVGH